MANDNGSLSHTKWNWKYHIVFAPKYRRQVVYRQIKADIGRIIRQLCEMKKVEIIEAEACPDHIHMLDTVDNSQINVLTQRTMHRICTAATNEEVSFAYRVAIPRQRFRWRNAFSTRWRSL